MSVIRIRFSRIALILLIAVITAALWIPLRIQFVNARHWIGDARAELDVLHNRSMVATTALEKAQRELKMANDRHDQVLAAVAKAGRALSGTDPETRWVTAPASLPEWDAESPYVWLRKEILPRLSISVFTEDGELRPEVAYVLTVDPAEQRRLNEQLKRLLGEYRTLEVSKAERSDEHLPGIAGQPGEKLTIRVQTQPEDGARIKQQFEAALAEALGPQRAELIVKIADTWIGSQFAQFGAEPKTISVIHHSSGSYNVSIKTGGNWFSTGGPAKVVLDQIPPHLRPMFSQLFGPDDAPKENL